MKFYSMVKKHKFKAWHLIWEVLILTTQGTILQAQVNVCPGQKVVLFMDPTPGSQIGFEFSKDLLAWEALTDSLAGDSLWFTPNGDSSDYWYLRAHRTDPGCGPFYSDTAFVSLGLPTVPESQPAQNIGLTGFRAVWKKTATPGVARYFLDVARDQTFDLKIPGYDNKDLGDSLGHNVLGLYCGSEYYFRVRVLIEGCGLSYNSRAIKVRTDSCPPPAECKVKSTCTGSLTDTRNSKTYNTVQIGDQCWMAQNLNIGSMIPGIAAQSQGVDNKNGSIEKYCYDDLEANCTTYGGFYLWDEAIAYGASVSSSPGPQGICPNGWHLPSDEEWTCLQKYLGDPAITAGKLKSTTSDWTGTNVGATNSSGFTALPAGGRNNTGTFFNKGTNAYFWTATESSSTNAWSRYLYNYSAEVVRLNDRKPLLGFSVRCIKDQ